VNVRLSQRSLRSPARRPTRAYSDEATVSHHTNHEESIAEIMQPHRSVTGLAAAPLVIAALLLGSSSSAVAAPSENASCVEKFNIAVGTPGEYQRVFHQDMLGRDVSFFARLGEECPFR